MTDCTRCDHPAYSHGAYLDGTLGPCSWDGCVCSGPVEHPSKSTEELSAMEYGTRIHAEVEAHGAAEELAARGLPLERRTSERRQHPRPYDREAAPPVGCDAPDHYQVLDRLNLLSEQQGASHEGSNARGFVYFMLGWIGGGAAMWGMLAWAEMLKP